MISQIYIFIWDQGSNALLQLPVWYLHFRSIGKEFARNVGGLGLIPGLGRSLGEGEGYPLQYSGLENSMDCIVHGVAKSRTRPSDFHFHFLPPRGCHEDISTCSKHNSWSPLDLAPTSPSGACADRQEDLLIAQGPTARLLLGLLSCYDVSNSFAASWTAAHQAHLCMGLPRQEYWCGFPFPSPGALPNPRV